MILAIDPGNEYSGFAVIGPDYRPVAIGKIPNKQILHVIEAGGYEYLRIEMIASYGMAVGKEVFETCVWIGRFIQCHNLLATEFSTDMELVYRRDIKLHHCESSKAKDANIIQALIDRFAPGEPNRGKGTKAAPGWFYGFSKDIWQAYALAVYAADTIGEK